MQPPAFAQPLSASRPKHYWLLSAAIHATLIFATCLHYAYGPERTVRLMWFFEKPAGLAVQYPDHGILYRNRHLKAIRDDEANFWKLGSFSGDSAAYLAQVDSLDKSEAPYKYRFLPTMLVRGLRDVTGWDAVKVFVVMNVVFTLTTALVFQLYLMRYFAFSELLALIGGVLFVTMTANTETVAFPMLEPASLFFSLLLHIAAVSGNCWLFVPAAVAGVATKEVLVVSAALWAINRFQTKDLRKLAFDLALSAVPIIAYVAIRRALGGAAIEVGYGFDLSKGEMPTYLHGILTKPGRLPEVVWCVLLSFSFLWLGLVNLGKHRFLLRSAITIPLVLFATLAFSSRVMRVLGVVFPVVIPAFLLFFVASTARRAQEPESRDS